MRQRIEEQLVPGKRLGRHINHDPRSLAYPFKAKAPVIRSVMHTRAMPIFDQGSLGSCTGNAAVGAVGTAPLYNALPVNHPVLDEAQAIAVYSAATRIDSATGNYPPADTGSDGLAVAKIAVKLGLSSGYQHTFTLTDALTALQTYPVITGVNWYEGFDRPNSAGIVGISGQVRGGHEFEVVGVDATTQLVIAANSWGTGYGAGGYFSFSWDAWERLLGEQGDVTVLLPLTVPAPNPTPVPDGTDAAFAAELHRWIDGKPWFYSKVRDAAAKWLTAKRL